MDIVSMCVVAVAIVGIAYLIDYHLDLDGSYDKPDNENV